ncbi:hypothetical protein PHLCEN_2v12239 [Hermanssonia centrifuga]|uniref:Uncharacterized protein n=1 Tax=Hermanssonia centrifuga TaxID=98765 RepID=A0A2R6NHM9_9APHY|nr:hypothetical protein PHLCEN_2v12239 [Hermanssonia centrifuga]
MEGFTETLAQELDPDWNIKVTLIEPGWFATAAVTGKATVLPAHPAYTKPGLPVVAVRSALENLNDPNNKFGNAEKAAHKFYELASLPDPPLRLILGQDAIEIIRSKMKSVASDIENFEAWSSDLL